MRQGPRRARTWLAEVLTYHGVEGLSVLDETSKDFDVLKGGYGYSLRCQTCSVIDQELSRTWRGGASPRSSPSHTVFP